MQSYAIQNFLFEIYVLRNKFASNQKLNKLNMHFPNKYANA